jgi:TolB-like protein
VVKGRASRTAATFDELLASVPELVAEAMGWEGAALARRFSLKDLKGKSFAVFPLGATGVDADTVRNLTELVASEVKRVEGVSVLGMSDVEALLEVESDRAQLGCTDDNSCLAELGGALGVDKIITGEIGRVGKRLLIGLRMIDREAVVVDNRVTEAFQGPDEQLLFATRHAVRELLGIDADGAGQLVVTANRSGATLFVDGEQRGTVPGPPLDGLAPGRHALRVSAPGYFDWQADVYVEPEGTTAQWVELEEEPRLVKPFVPTWVYWSSWAATGAVGVGAVAAGMFTGAAVILYQLQLGGDEDGVIDGFALTRTYNVAAAGLWLTAGASLLGGALAGATGLSTLVVTWEEGS